MRGKQGPDSKQIRDIEDHAGKVFATLAPHLVLEVGDVLQGRGLRKIREYDQRREVNLTPWETRLYFTVQQKPNVEPYFCTKRFGEIVEKTGLSKPTVSYHLDMLIAQGLVIKASRRYLVNPLHFQL